MADIVYGTKVVGIEAGGALYPIFMGNATWTGPLLRADRFLDQPAISNQPGIHALRYGALAAPETAGLALLRVRAIGRFHASPWAWRAEAALVEEVTILHDDPYAEAVRRVWARHCPVREVPRGAPSLGRSLTQRWYGPRFAFQAFQRLGELSYRRRELLIEATCADYGWSVRVSRCRGGCRCARSQVEYELQPGWANSWWEVVERRCRAYVSERLAARLAARVLASNVPPDIRTLWDAYLESRF